MKIIPFVADILIIYIFFGQSIISAFKSREKRNTKEIKDYIKQLKHYLWRNKDILPQIKMDGINQSIQFAQELLDNNNADDIAEFVKINIDDNIKAGLLYSLIFRKNSNDGKIKSKLPKTKKQPKLEFPEAKSTTREFLEVVMVALPLAFGIRALFLQPFKIPTGSMQPTLFGIHFEHIKEPIKKNKLQLAFAYIHHSRRYVDLTIRKTGELEAIGVYKQLPIVGTLFPKTELIIAGEKYILPGKPEKVASYCNCPQGGIYQKGEILARGYLELGDHLFVDRTYLAFHEPKRGDITVFATNGIISPNTHTALHGMYYIKRLVAIPGDTIYISKRTINAKGEIELGKLYIKPKGAKEFKLMNSTPFKRIYSKKGGYHGYYHSNRSVQQPFTDDLFDKEKGYTLGEDQYFMLGDNSENSLDGRYWGVVPRKNIIGKPAAIWWPFSWRWGRPDKAEPRDFPTNLKHSQQRPLT